MDGFKKVRLTQNSALNQTNPLIVPKPNWAEHRKPESGIELVTESRYTERDGAGYRIWKHREKLILGN